MRSLAAFALFLLAAPAPEIRYFHFERPVAMPSQASGQACMAVTPDVYLHASPALADLRLYQGANETPYVIRSDVPAASASQTIALLNLGKKGGETAFDAAMPQGSYSDVELGVKVHDFLATVNISGSQSQTGGARTKLGSFTIFDLTKQRLGRSTVLHLPNSDFRFLHFQIAGPITPDNVTGLTVTRPPESKPEYLGVAETSTATLKGRDSVFVMDVFGPPVDRIVFVPGTNSLNFSRDVEIRVDSLAPRKADDSSEPPLPVSGGGNILRVHSLEDGHHIDEEHLAIDAPQADFNEQRWTITIENHDDAPIPMYAVRLEMLERRLCFDAAAGSTYALYYGDAALAAPVYDYAALFSLQKNPAAAQLGPEAANPAFQPRPDDRPFTEKHPALLWVALVLVIVMLGLVAFRSFKPAAQRPS